VRTSRALEVFEQTGIPISALRRQAAATPPPWCLFSVLLDLDLAFLRPRIAARVDAMMEAGFLDEVRALRAAGHGGARALQGLGYQQLGQHLDDGLGLDEAVGRIKLATAAYARRQRTWFRREEVSLRAQQPLLPGPLAHLIHGYFAVQRHAVRGASARG